MGNLVFQATLGGQVNLVGPNTASTFNLNVPAVAGTLVTTGDTGTVTNTMCATSVYTAPGTIGSGTPNTGAFTTLSATGVASFAAGSAAAPAITRTGDTDTGIFFPAANTLAFSTNGTEDARFDASGNFGLGVTPSAWSGFTASQVKNGSVASTGNDVFLNANCFYNGVSWRYVATAAASQFYEDSGSFIWRTAASGSAGGTVSFTQAMTLDASGKLGIGTTSPSQYLSVSGTDGSNNVASFTRSGGATLYTYVDTGNNVGFFSGSNASGAGFYANSGDSSARIMAGGAERARIDSSGNLLVGITSVPSAGSGGSGFYVDSNGRRGLAMSTTSTAANTLVAFMNPNGTVGSINTSGSLTAYNVSSDYRLKENIVPLTGALEKIAQLKPSLYNYKADPTTNIEGFIAHELQTVVPHAVTGEKDAVDEEGNPIYQGVDASFLIPFLTAAIQEQQAIIQQLQADVAALKGQA